ncbi:MULTISPECIES: hypothetical protein [unclassified Pseudomonas]|uniref:hypothetical protein n=1 Tax=unclassified Pseudomonas TaxID=196821 RepID=UPI00128D7B8E|nr:MULTISPECIES: hypothetical protein [unclassified Pseudomonas]MPQ68549.1 hypothetical protein [Pseudomonas sp. MWU12-2323]
MTKKITPDPPPVRKSLSTADRAVYLRKVSDCSGLMKPDTHLGENTRQIEVSDDQTTPYLFR